MKGLLIFIFVIFCSLEAKAQKNIDNISLDNPNSENNHEDEYGQPLPYFPGDWDAWYKFLNKNLKWPKINAGKKIFPVTVTMSIENDGSLTSFKILKSPGEKFSRAVLKVLKMSPKWIPIKKNGRPIRTSHWTLRIGFYSSNK